MSQQTLNFRANTVHISSFNNSQKETDTEPEQSKDDIWKFRLESRSAARLQSLLDAKKINRSIFMRDCIEIGEVYHGYKDILLDNSDLVIELLKRISKKI